MPPTQERRQQPIQPQVKSMPIFSPPSLQSRWRLAIGWLAVSTLCYGAGFPLGFALGGTLLWGWVVAGFGMGLLQWMLLIHVLPRPGWFALSGGAGLVLGVGGGFLIGNLVLQSWGLAPAFGAIGALVGLPVGVTQWLALRQQTAKSIWWIPANVLGYTGGLLAGGQVPAVFPFASTVIFGPEFGLTIGFTVGVVTGITLLFILAQTAAAGPLPEQLLEDIELGSVKDEIQS